MICPQNPVLVWTFPCLMKSSDHKAFNKAHRVVHRSYEHYGQWDCYHGNYRWQNLKVASDYVLHQWQGEAHRALADTRATKAVWEYLTIPEVRERIDALRRV